MTRYTPANDADSVHDQAIAWLMRVESDQASEADWLGLEAWLAQAPEHRDAFEALEVMSSAIPDDAAAIAPLLDDDAPREGVLDMIARGRVSRRGWMAAGISAAAAVLVATVGFGILGQASTSTYETARGETRTVRLEDGSVIGLNGASRIRVRFERGQRRVFMDNAEAAFDVAHDPSRPFVIEAGDQRVQVVGTEFNVRNAPDAVTVTVRRGVVKVSGPSGPAERLTVGMQLVHRAGAAGSAVGRVAPDDAFAWKTGRIVSRDQRLEDIVADLNRRLPTPITVAGPAKDLRFTGVLVVDDESRVLAAIEAYLPVRATRESGAIRLESR